MPTSGEERSGRPLGDFCPNFITNSSEEQKREAEPDTGTQNPSFPELQTCERSKPRVRAPALCARIATASAARMAAQAAPL